MGSTGSRTGQRKVAPCKSLQEEGPHPKPQWTLPALPVTVEQSSGSLGQRKTALPPLKQEMTLSTFSEPCFAEGLPPKQSDNSSIIHSHPPRRPQALQPLALHIGHTGTANQIVMGRDRRGGDVHRFSTTGQTGRSGTGRMIQGGFLEAQTALVQQAHRHRRAHLSQAREQRRHKVVYTANGPNTEGIQRLKLVRRPTERDIFWDEATGERLDPSCFLDTKSLPHHYEERGEERIQQTEHRGLSSWTNEREMVSVEDRGKTQRNGWMGPESTRSSQTGRITGPRGIWDHKLD